MVEAETWKGRVYQLEQLLRSVERDVKVESVPAPAHTVPVRTPQAKQPDLDHYIAIAEHAQKRAEQLEREALEVSPTRPRYGIRANISFGSSLTG